MEWSNHDCFSLYCLTCHWVGWAEVHLPFKVSFSPKETITIYLMWLLWRWWSMSLCFLVNSSMMKTIEHTYLFGVLALWRNCHNSAADMRRGGWSSLVASVLIRPQKIVFFCICLYFSFVFLFCSHCISLPQLSSWYEKGWLEQPWSKCPNQIIVSCISTCICLFLHLYFFVAPIVFHCHN